MQENSYFWFIPGIKAVLAEWFFSSAFLLIHCCWLNTKLSRQRLCWISFDYIWLHFGSSEAKGFICILKTVTSSTLLPPSWRFLLSFDMSKSEVLSEWVPFCRHTISISLWKGLSFSLHTVMGPNMIQRKHMPSTYSPYESNYGSNRLHRWQNITLNGGQSNIIGTNTFTKISEVNKFPLPNPVSCPVMNKICLNQIQNCICCDDWRETFMKQSVNKCR